MSLILPNAHRGQHLIIGVRINFCQPCSFAKEANAKKESCPQPRPVRNNINILIMFCCYRQAGFGCCLLSGCDISAKLLDNDEY